MWVEDKKQETNLEWPFLVSLPFIPLKFFLLLTCEHVIKNVLATCVCLFLSSAWKRIALSTTAIIN